MTEVFLADLKEMVLVSERFFHTVAQLLAEYLAKVTPTKSMHSQRRDRMVLERSPRAGDRCGWTQSAASWSRITWRSE